LQTTAQVCPDDNSLYDGVLSGGLSGSNAPGTDWEFYSPVIGLPGKREINQSDVGVLEFVERDVEAHASAGENEVISTVQECKSVATIIPRSKQLRKRANDGYNPGKSDEKGTPRHNL
jgi:hypothetical protein